MEIRGTTRVTGLFGWPVTHTLSPSMQNAAFRHLGLDFCYVPFAVSPDALGAAVAGIRALNLAGVNVTVPHKEAVIALLDEVDPEASFIGAVNTVVNRDNRLIGYNTDGRGFMRSLEEQSIDPQGTRILVVGSGGACRAISYYLSEKAAALTIADIDRSRAERLAADLGRIRSNVTASPEYDPAAFDIIVNATPLGLHRTDPLPFSPDRLGPQQTVCDLIYRPTPLLEQARSRGCITLDGLGMLLWQGALALQLWTGAEPPVAVMRAALHSNMTT